MESQLEAKSLEHAALLFDCDHYRKQLDIFNDWSDEDLFAHYLSNGWRHGLDPHPCFSTRYYLLQVPDLQNGDVAPLLHYLQENSLEVQPHVLFDTYFYLGELEKKRRTITGNALIHYLTDGYKIADPHPLFDTQYYLTEYKKTTGIPGVAPVSNILKSASRDIALSLLNGDSEIARYERAPLVHYLTEGHLQNCSPHPLFSIDYYKQQGHQEDLDPLSHYLLGGYQKLGPHPLVSFEYIVKFFEHPDVAPLLEYIIRMAETVPPHPLFDYEFYRMQLKEAGIKTEEPPVLHYLKHGHRLKLTPSVLFDPVFYDSQGFDLRKSQLDAFSHFLSDGHLRNKHPHPFIDTFYLRNVSKQKQLSVHQVLEDISLDFRKYADCKLAPSVKGSILADINIIERWVLGECRSFMDAFWKCAEEKVSSIYKHFAVEGAFGTPRRYGKRDEQFPRYQAIFYQVNTNLHGVSIVNLELAKEFARRGIEIIFFSSEAGVLDTVFRQVGRLYVLDSLDKHSLGGNLTASLLQKHRPGLTFAILNGLYSEIIAPYLSACRIPILAWINETLDATKESASHTVFSNADQIIYPSKYTQKTYKKFPNAEGRILPTARMPIDRGGTPIVSVQIPQDCTVVLAVGSPVDRKQPSLFLEFAYNLLQKGCNCYFLWVGDERNIGAGMLRNFEYKHESIRGRVSFIEKTADVRPYYELADVLVHTSLDDPFPGCITEALGYNIPVVAFSDSTGSEEVFAGKGAVFVPRAATDAMASATLDILNNPESYKQQLQAAQTILETELHVSSFADQFLGMAARELGVRSIGSFQSKQPTIRTPTRKIRFITATWSISGVHQVLEELTNSLNQRGWDARVLLADTRSRESYSPPECAFDSLNAFGKKDKESQADYFMQYLDHLDSAILVMAFEHTTSSLSSLIPDRFGIVGLLQSDEDVYYETAYRLGRYWNHMISVSPLIQENVNAMNPLFKEKNTFVFNSTVGQREITAERTLRSSKHISLLYTGRFEKYQKNIALLIPLVQELYEKQVDFTLTLIGGEDVESELAIKRTLKTAIADKRLQIIGRVPHANLAAYYKAADVFLLPSRYEGFPLSLLEAMAYGCVPVTADIKSGVPELIPNESIGFTFPQNDSKEAARLIQKLATHPELVLQMSKRAQEHIRQNFYAEKMVDQYETVFELVAQELASGYQRPPDLSWQNRYGTRHFPFF